MKKIPLIILILALLPACASWSNTDKWLARGVVAGQGADWAVTHYGFNNGFVEASPVLGNMNSGEILATKIGGTALILWLADSCPRYRRHILIIGNVLGWGAAGWNYSQVRK